VAVKPSLRKEDWKGRQKVGCGYPPSIARSQKVRGGILGITIQKREQSFGAALLKSKYKNRRGSFEEKFKAKQTS
jgi:hypothetical protein